MTDLWDIWELCRIWDGRYNAELRRQNIRSRRASVATENRDDPGAAPTAPGPADTPVLKERNGDVST